MGAEYASGVALTLADRPGMVEQRAELADGIERSERSRLSPKKSKKARPAGDLVNCRGLSLL